jgi:hypothetical protein
MSRITDYMVLEAPAGAIHVDPPLDQLRNMVLHQLKEGWQPIGGIATSTRLEDGWEKTYFLQAMVKHGHD